MLRRFIFFFIGLALVQACVSEPEGEKLSFKPKVSAMEDSVGHDERGAVGDFTELVSKYENEDRQYWQKPDEVINSLGDLSDKVVADIGAGTGYFTLRMLPKAKKVIAIDIDERMIKFINELKKDLDTKFSDKLEVRLAKADDPELKIQEADIIFLSNTYAYIGDRVNYFQKLRRSLAKNGRLVIVDFKKKGIPVHPDQSTRVALYQVENELSDAGYEIIKSDDRSLPYQYILEAKVDMEQMK